MARPKKRMGRPLGQRRYRRLFVLATEGARTEPEYFRIFRDLDHTHLEFVPPRQASSPDHVLRAMRRRLRSAALLARDQAWIVIDTDSWTDAQLQAVHAWSLEAANHGLAVSNPMFEYWLLLHFEDGDGLAGAADCRRRLARHLAKGPRAGLPLDSLRSGLDAAVARAGRRDQPPCSDWPRTTGSTVYRLVRALRGGGAGDGVNRG